jgi:4-amino-4-deoxy-L-arabinose transferase-like glycosyltransferase
MTSRGTHRSRSRVHLDLTVVLALAILGQTLLVLIGEVAPDLVRFTGVGPKIAPDTKGYLTAAERLPRIEDEWWGKILYVSLLRLGLALGFVEWFAVLVQCLLAVGAGVALVDLGRGIDHPSAGRIAAAVWLLNPQTTQWTSVLIPDSAFMSMMVLTLWASHRAILDPSRWGPALASAVLVALLRPNGILAVASVGVLWVWARGADRRPTRTSLLARFSSSIAIVAVVVLALGFSPAHRSGTGGPADHPLERLVAGEVVWGEADWSRTMPPAADGERSLTALVRYAVSAPVQTLDVGIRRIGVEFIQVRPHYPRPVNILVGGTMLVYLAAAALGARAPAGRTLRRPVLTLVIPMLAGIGATWASPEGRFGWAFLVLLAPWVGIGLDRSTARFRGLRRGPRSAPR